MKWKCNYFFKLKTAVIKSLCFLIDISSNTLTVDKESNNKACIHTLLLLLLYLSCEIVTIGSKIGARSNILTS